MVKKVHELEEWVRAMLGQALAEMRTRGAARLTHLHLVMYDRSPETWDMVREAVARLAAGTPAEGARLVPSPAQSNFICWNCCGLRFQTTEEEAVCPNCGSPGLIVPDEVIFSLDHVEVV